MAVAGAALENPQDRQSTPRRQQVSAGEASIRGSEPSYDGHIMPVLEAVMDYRKKFIVAPDKKLRLSEIDPADTPDQKSETGAADLTEEYRNKLAQLQT